MTAPSAGLRAGDIEAEARTAAAAALAASAGAAAEAEAARAAIAVADRVMAELARQPDVAASLADAACRAGCSWCCHQVVGITTAEDSLLAEAIAALPAPARALLHGRRREAAARLARLPVEQWQAARVPCPLLDESGLCVVHPSRPLPCRAVLSADAAACRAWREGEDVRIPLVALPRRVYSLAQSGLAQALAGAGIPPGPMSLIEALEMMVG
jgi:Fe-S-cluster containining protein